MHQELIKQAMGLFDTPEKWNTFLELVWQKDTIREPMVFPIERKSQQIFYKRRCSQWLVIQFLGRVGYALVSFQTWGQVNKPFTWLVG